MTIKMHNCHLYGLDTLNQIRLYHWFSKSRSEHKILNDLYDDFSGAFDRLIESMISRGLLKNKNSLLESKEEYKNVKELVEWNVKEYSKFEKAQKDPEVKNIAADICEIFGKAKYLLDMKP